MLTTVAQELPQWLIKGESCIISLINFSLRYIKHKEVDKKRKRQPRNDNEVEDESTFAWRCDHWHRGCKARIRIKGDHCVKDLDGTEHTCGQEPNSFRPEIADVNMESFEMVAMLKSQGFQK